MNAQGEYPPLALKLYAFGLRRLFDPNWTGMELYDKVKRYVRGRKEPRELLQRPTRPGFLELLGSFLFEDFFFQENCIQTFKPEYLEWHAEDFVSYCDHHSILQGNKNLGQLRTLLQHVWDLYDIDEPRYHLLIESRKHRDKITCLVSKAIDEGKQDILETSQLYIASYAERVIHDRQLCGYLAELLVRIGFDGFSENGNPTKWAKRPGHWPSWVTEVLRARERGHCAQCGLSFIELDGKENVDHIIPLAKAGCNDIVNLQLLCSRCNTNKSANLFPVKTSVPCYLKRRR